MTTGMLIGYNDDGDVVATLDYVVAYDEAGRAVGLVDFTAHERAGRQLTELWVNSASVGSGVWPEWIGARAHDFRVELDGPRIRALVHKVSGHRRERAAIEAEIDRRVEKARQLQAEIDRAPTARRAVVRADLRGLVGGPLRPLELDDEGRTIGRAPARFRTPDSIPVRLGGAEGEAG